MTILALYVLGNLIVNKNGVVIPIVFLIFAVERSVCDMNAKIKSMIPKIQEYMKTKPILRAWIFGSYSRGEETPDSDIDILVDYDESTGALSLFKIGGMLMDLSELLGCHVDLVENKGLMRFARKSVDLDKILIYERGS